MALNFPNQITVYYLADKDPNNQLIYNFLQRGKLVKKNEHLKAVYNKLYQIFRPLTDEDLELALMRYDTKDFAIQGNEEARHVEAKMFFVYNTISGEVKTLTVEGNSNGKGGFVYTRANLEKELCNKPVLNIRHIYQLKMGKIDNRNYDKPWNITPDKEKKLNLTPLYFGDFKQLWQLKDGGVSKAFVRNEVV